MEITSITYNYYLLVGIVAFILVSLIALRSLSLRIYNVNSENEKPIQQENQNNITWYNNSDFRTIEENSIRNYRTPNTLVRTQSLDEIHNNDDKTNKQPLFRRSSSATVSANFNIKTRKKNIHNMNRNRNHKSQQSENWSQNSHHTIPSSNFKSENYTPLRDTITR